VLTDTAIGGQQHDALEDVDEFDTLSEVYDMIRENYVLSDEMTDEELIYGAATGMLDALNDADHSYFMDPEQTERNEDSLNSELVGIGVQINYEVSPPVIIYPLADTPAFEAGILPGDVVLSVDGVDVTTKEPAEISALIRGDAGTDITLELRHVGETESYTVTITRRQMELNAVSWAMLPNDIQWVRLNNFSTDSSDRIVEALQAGAELDAAGVILDLRGNSGGWIDEAIQIASEFEPIGSVVFQSQDETGDTKVYETTLSDGEWQEGPLVVLVDANTASSGELLSATLKDNNRAILVGQTTLGLGTSVLFYDLNDGSSMALSIDLWLTPDGDVMLNNGIAPHLNVPLAPGTTFALPYLFEDNTLTADDVDALEDDQLRTGYQVMLDLIENPD
jgi:carboxyl-terminal processing protease